MKNCAHCNWGRSLASLGPLVVVVGVVVGWGGGRRPPLSEPVSRSMSESVARSISEPDAQGIAQLNQAAIHAADGWSLKSPTSGPNNAPSMVPLAATFTLLKALADNSAEQFERAVVELCEVPVLPVGHQSGKSPEIPPRFGGVGASRGHKCDEELCSV